MTFQQLTIRCSQTKTVQYTSSSVYHLVLALTKVGFVTEAVIVRTAVTSVVGTAHCCSFVSSDEYRSINNS